MAITSPPDGYAGFGGVDATITADASDSDGAVAQVEFFAELVAEVRDRADASHPGYRPGGPGGYP